MNAKHAFSRVTLITFCSLLPSVAVLELGTEPLVVDVELITLLTAVVVVTLAVEWLKDRLIVEKSSRSVTPFVTTESVTEILKPIVAGGAHGR